MLHKEKIRIKAFTVLELLISMTLTGILIGFAFSGFNKMQILFNDYEQQNKFISDLNQLNFALNKLSQNSCIIEKLTDKTIKFKTDSTNVHLKLIDSYVLLEFAQHTDTFFLESRNLNIYTLNYLEYFPNEIVTGVEIDIFYKKQKYMVSFKKQYDSHNILKQNIITQPIDARN